VHFEDTWNEGYFLADPTKAEVLVTEPSGPPAPARGVGHALRPHGGVFLDLIRLARATIRKKLPRMDRQFVDAPLVDIAEEPMEVSPTAHYSMGGVSVPPESAPTDVAGLFEACEITGGLHGANRHGGNSLIETVVFGARAGSPAAERSRSL